MDGVEHLYKSFGVLADAKEKAGEFPEEYQIILNSSKGSSGEKRLGATFIPRFFKYFPDDHLTALNCLMDLCEDDEAAIRRLAIKALPTVCHDSKDHIVVKIADVLTQLLPTDQALESTIVLNALKEVTTHNPKASVLGIFSLINVGDEEAREHAISFLKQNVINMIPKIFHSNPEAEETLAEEIRKALPDAVGDEFQVFVDILSKLKTLESKHDQLVELISEQAELNNDLQVDDPESLQKFLTCFRSAIPFFQKGANAEPFFNYIVEKALPVLEDINCSGGDEITDFKLEILKNLAEICSHKISVEALHLSLEPIFSKLLHYMPLPVVKEGKSDEEDSDESSETHIEFSHVECLMYTFHQVARKFPEFLTADDAADRLRDFKLRLQYVGQRCQMYIKQIKMALNDKSGKDEDKKVKVIALRTTSNIHTLIKDLFHSPPSYNNHVSLSWITTKPNQVTTTTKEPSLVKTDTVLDEKRKRAGITPITFDDASRPKKTANNKKSRMEYYLPPGRRVGADNGSIEGTFMPPKYNRGGGNRGFRGGGGNRGFGGRRGRGQSRGGYRGNRGWRW